MNLQKRLYMEEAEKAHAEAEAEGRSLPDSEIDRLASERAIDRFASMCDDAKDRAKYE